MRGAKRASVVGKGSLPPTTGQLCPRPTSHHHPRLASSPLHFAISAFYFRFQALLLSISEPFAYSSVSTIRNGLTSHHGSAVPAPNIASSSIVCVHDCPDPQPIKPTPQHPIPDPKPPTLNPQPQAKSHKHKLKSPKPETRDPRCERTRMNPHGREALHPTTGRLCPRLTSHHLPACSYLAEGAGIVARVCMTSYRWLAISCKNLSKMGLGIQPHVG